MDRIEKLERKNFARALEARTQRFAVEVIRLSASLPDSPEASVVRRQMTKAGTSVGANYREANRARSRADFRSRIKICESEASETRYWMAVIKDLGWLATGRTEPVNRECEELLALFTAIGKNTDPKKSTTP